MMTTKGAGRKGGKGERGERKEALAARLVPVTMDLSLLPILRRLLMHALVQGEREIEVEEMCPKPESFPGLVMVSSP